MKFFYNTFIVLFLAMVTATITYAQDCNSAQECYQTAISIGYTEEAVKYLTKAESLWTEEDGKEKMLWILKARGNCYITIENYPKAIQDYNKMIQLKPESNIDLSEAFLSRGNVMARSGNLQGSIASYDKAIEVSPPNLLAYLNKAIAYKEAGMEQECIAEYKKAAELGSSKAISYLYHDYNIDHRPAQKAALANDTDWQQIEQLKDTGSALTKSGDYDGALAAYIEAEERYRSRGDSENKMDVIIQQAYINRLKKEYTEAIANAARAAYNDLGSEAAFIELGYALYESGDQLGGVEACEKGLKRFPSSKSIKGAIAWMYSTSAGDFYDKQDYVTAYNLYYKAYRANPDVADAIKNAAIAAYAGKYYKESLNAYYIAVGIDPSLSEEVRPYIEYLQSVVK